MHWGNRILLSRLFVACLLVASLGNGGGRAAQTAKPLVFPVITAYNLEKNKVTLPADLAGANNLLILSYSLSQQKDAESWAAPAKSIADIRSDFRLYMLPIFPRQNILYRLWMNYSMRSESPTAENWRGTIPLYVNKEHFDQDLDIRSESAITVLLVDKAGKVLWRTDGMVTDDKKAALLSELTSGAH